MTDLPVEFWWVAIPTVFIGALWLGAVCLEAGSRLAEWRDPETPSGVDLDYQHLATLDKWNNRT